VSPKKVVPSTPPDIPLSTPHVVVEIEKPPISISESPPVPASRERRSPTTDQDRKQVATIRQQPLTTPTTDRGRIPATTITGRKRAQRPRGPRVPESHPLFKVVKAIGKTCKYARYNQIRYFSVDSSLHVIVNKIRMLHRKIKVLDSPDSELSPIIDFLDRAICFLESRANKVERALQDLRDKGKKLKRISKKPCSKVQLEKVVGYLHNRLDGHLKELQLGTMTSSLSNYQNEARL
jgi:hypothetical protein